MKGEGQNGSNMPEYLPPPREVEMRRDFIWFCREFKWPEDIQRHVLLESDPGLDTAMMVIEMYGVDALPVLEGLRCQ